MEIWKNIPGYKKIYSCSSYGKIRREIGGRGLCKSGKILKTITNHSGYQKLTLCKEGIRDDFFIHTLVAKIFIGNKPKGFDVNHKNGIKTNNNIDNLEYITHSENQFHSYHVLNRYRCKGSKHGRSKLTEEQVKDIRNKYKNGQTQVSLAKEFKMSIYTIGAITRRKLWQHI